MTNLTLSEQQRENLIGILKERFEKNQQRHPNLDWERVAKKLENNPEELWSLNEMERTGGEPDVVDFDHKTGQIIFYDCSPESPAGRRNTCYDRKAQQSRKVGKPAHNAVDMAAEIGIEILTEEQYKKLQQLGKFDLKTSSWIKTPDNIRNLGGALFCDRRYNHVFVYHNGAQSYYGTRGFRGLLRI